ncbi:MAG: GLUG motif-containing protein [Planctomycetota bacterium]|jgi:hypothetical protein
MTPARSSNVPRIVAILFAFCCFSFPAYAQYGGGSGTTEDPYLIYTPEQMNEIGAEPNDWDKQFKLTADIDLSEYSGDAFNTIGEFYYESDLFDRWIPRPFIGIFDGNGHTISNFSYTSTNAKYVGLFGCISWTAVIKDLGLIDPNVDAGSGSHIGPLVGVLINGTVTNCYVEGGSVAGGDTVGGLVGSYGEGVGGNADPPYTISNCYSTTSVKGGSHVGGLVGTNYVGKIVNSYSTGNVSGTETVGGLVGQNGSTWHWPPTPGTILNCYSTGLVSGEYNVGGLVGLYRMGPVIGCLWDMETSGQSRSACGAGKTTSEMKTADTFAGWGGCGNEGIWTIDEGNDYPRLWWENKPGMLLEGQLSDFLRGDGTEGNPYLVHTAEQLNMIGMFPCEWDRNFKLMADVDLKGFTGTDFNIIGVNWTNPFTGVFDGDSHTISNFTYISRDRSFIGLFGYVIGENAKIKDLGMTNSYVYANAGLGLRASHVGSMVGRLEGGTITDCYVDGGSVSGNDSVGGLVGWLDNGNIINCYSLASVTSDDWRVGGMVGMNYDGEITNCYSGGSVSGNDIVGGLAGRNSGTIAHCYSVARVAGDERVGGLVGSNGKYGTVSGFWDVETSGLAASDGGIGKTTAEMQTASTFLQAGWDFIDETANGTEDIWWIDEGKDYPRLWRERPLFVVVDDFESYNDDGEPNEALWHTWIDGFNIPENGAIVACLRIGDWDCLGTVHSGEQAMPLEYHNSGPAYLSETKRTWETPQGWKIDEADRLTLYFRGEADNTDLPLYVGPAVMRVFHNSSSCLE